MEFYFNPYQFYIKIYDTDELLATIDCYFDTRTNMRKINDYIFFDIYEEYILEYIRDNDKLLYIIQYQDNIRTLEIMIDNNDIEYIKDGNKIIVKLKVSQ